MQMQFDSVDLASRFEICVTYDILTIIKNLRFLRAHTIVKIYCAHVIKCLMRFLRHPSFRTL
jgi:hypothetical protein